MNYPVRILEYNPEWKMQFKQEKAHIGNVLGDNAISIEHIGSTSVEGLMAKPIIDIAVAVRDLNDADSFVEPLMTIGYEYVPKVDFIRRRFFRKGEWRKGTHHLHVYEITSNEWRNNLLFRDYLRSSPVLLNQYAELKKQLAKYHSNNRNEYTKSKAPFIQRVIEMARKENVET
ncbi:GrpB family protein [Paenibacillus sp. N3.4]|uniref:GrpB family protein n=1 Tax=Paenibacillus sp. N3.4 TaxID=2603222 RepID=UPI0011C81A5A|nr:GrpB family protein [Paenibacillus sp. N3.4]TXK85767.1 GrpB family protein [Paenibacillus sp. N3.4]